MIYRKGQKKGRLLQPAMPSGSQVYYGWEGISHLTFIVSTDISKTLIIFFSIPVQRQKHQLQEKPYSFSRGLPSHASQLHSQPAGMK